MTVSQYASLKMEAVLDLIYRLKDTDFPYSHSKDALYKVESVFKELQQNLGKAEARGDNLLIRTICTRILEQIFRFLPVIGFILRSTNVRNAFEVHGPLLRMSKKLLGPETKLLVSSEWDYSPYTYRPIPFLEHFVFIGLPSTESSNPLVIPLAGHELGHSIWQQYMLDNYLTLPLQESVISTIRTNRRTEFKQFFPDTSDEPSELGNSRSFNRLLGRSWPGLLIKHRNHSAISSA